MKISRITFFVLIISNSLNAMLITRARNIVRHVTTPLTGIDINCTQSGYKKFGRRSGCTFGRRYYTNILEPKNIGHHDVINCIQKACSDRFLEPYYNDIFSHLLSGSKQEESGLTTALHLSCTYNLPLFVETCLNHGANPNATDMQGRISLHFAQCPGVVRRLYKEGASINAADYVGNIPLHTCSSDIVEELIRHGSNTEIVNYGTIIVRPYDHLQRSSMNILLSIIERNLPNMEYEPEYKQGLPAFAYKYRLTPPMKAILDGNLEKYRQLVRHSPLNQTHAKKCKTIAIIQWFKTNDARYRALIN